MKNFVNDRNFTVRDIRIDRALATGDVEWFYRVLNEEDNGYISPKVDRNKLTKERQEIYEMLKMKNLSVKKQQELLEKLHKMNDEDYPEKKEG